MRRYHITVPVATALVFCCSATKAQSFQQSTTANHAPQTAIAIGPAYAAIEINPMRSVDPHASMSSRVSVHHPLTVVAPPGWHVTLRVGGQR